MSYRDDMSEFKREGTWTFWQLLPLFFVSIIVLSAFFFGLRSIGMFGSVAVERVVFETAFNISRVWHREGQYLRLI